MLNIKLNRTPSRMPTRARPRRAQRGVVLLVALIVLVIMTLAGIALMRSVSTSSVIAGNLAFQQSATHSADIGVESAISALQKAAVTDLQSSGVLSGSIRYVAHREDPAAGQNWDTYWTSVMPASEVNTLPVDAAGNTVSYVIHRLCNADGVEFTTVACSASPIAAANAAGTSHTTGLQVTAPPPPYYRITARVAGPRNTVSYVQVVVSL